MTPLAVPRPPVAAALQAATRLPVRATAHLWNLKRLALQGIRSTHSLSAEHKLFTAMLDDVHAALTGEAGQ